MVTLRSRTNIVSNWSKFWCATSVLILSILQCICSILKFVYPLELKPCVILSFKLFVFFQCSHNLKYSCNSTFLFDDLFIYFGLRKTTHKVNGNCHRCNSVFESSWEFLPYCPFVSLITLFSFCLVWIYQCIGPNLYFLLLMMHIFKIWYVRWVASIYPVHSLRWGPAYDFFLHTAWRRRC